MKTVRKEGSHHRLPNNNTVTMEAVTKKAVTVDTVEEKDVESKKKWGFKL